MAKYVEIIPGKLYRQVADPLFGPDIDINILRADIASLTAARDRIKILSTDGLKDELLADVEEGNRRREADRGLIETDIIRLQEILNDIERVA